MGLTGHNYIIHTPIYMDTIITIGTRRGAGSGLGVPNIGRERVFGRESDGYTVDER